MDTITHIFIPNMLMKGLGDIKGKSKSLSQGPYTLEEREANKQL